MTSNAEPRLSFVPNQGEALFPVSIDFLHFASLCVIRYRSTTRRGFLCALIVSVHRLTFDAKLIMTACYPSVAVALPFIKVIQKRLICLRVNASYILMAFI